MKNGNDGNGSDRFEAGFGLWRIGIRGPNVLFMLIILLFFAGFTYINIGTLHQHALLAIKEHDDIKDTQEALLDEARLIAFLVSLPEEKRPRVVLPIRLRERIIEMDRTLVPLPRGILPGETP